MLVNYQAVTAESEYRTEKLRNRHQSNGRLQESAQVVFVATALAIVLAACGVPSGNESGVIEAPAQIRNGVVTDPGPQHQPNYEVLNDILNAGPVAIAPEFGRMAAPTWQPSAGKLAEVLPGHGVFAGPGWQPDTAALEEVLGFDTSVFAGPTHQPDYGKLDQILNPEYSTPASGPG